jgi:hypothetical protein
MKWMLMALALVGCARSTGGMDGARRDMSVGGTPGEDLGNTGTGGNGGDDMAPATSAADLAQPNDLAPPNDLAQANDLGQSNDLAQPADTLVHVYIDNFCNSSTSPTAINAPLHVPLTLVFKNESHDYEADIWSSGGYGVLGLELGNTWIDKIDHCLNPVPYTEYFDVGIRGGPVGSSCPNVRLLIHCN